MLTKSLLKYTVRSDKIFPKYVKPDDSEALSFARYLVDIYSSAKGKGQQELSDKVMEHEKSHLSTFAGLNKLLEDRCVFSEQENTLEDVRWQLFTKAMELRSSGRIEIDAFQKAIAAHFRSDFADIEERLYGDLPEFRLIKEFKPIQPVELIHRYNASQVQGLILRSRSLSIVIRDKDPIKKRRLLQRLKFWRLLAEIEEDPEELRLSLSGPLSLFDKSATYGSRLSNFFPNVLLMDRWEINGEIKIQEKVLALNLDSSRSIKSHYESFKGYIPPEFKEFMEAFNGLCEDQRRGWVAVEGEEVLNLGLQSYSVPDMSFIHSSGKKVHLELFHKWHESQLKQRVDALGSEATNRLLLGVSIELLPAAALKEMLKNSPQLASNIFTFKRFPTPKAIMAHLS